MDRVGKSKGRDGGRIGVGKVGASGFKIQGRKKLGQDEKI